MTNDPRLQRSVASQPYPLLFATISGAHLYGFPSRDSDFDLRAAHILAVEKVVGLDVYDETAQESRMIDGLEMAFEASSLTEMPSEETRRALNDLLIGVRLKR